LSSVFTRHGLPDASAKRLDSYIVTIALTLKPNAPSSTGTDGVRIGQHGSLLIRPDGSWHDFAGDVSGRGALPLIAHLLDSEQHELNPVSTSRFAQRWLTEHPGDGDFQAAPFDPSQVTEQAKRNADFAAHVLRGCQSLSDTAGAVYLRSRGVLPPYPNGVTFYPDARHGESALVGIRSMPDGRIVGVQLGYLDPHGKKSTVEPNRRSFLSELDPDKRRGSAFRIPATPVPEALHKALGTAEADSEDDEPRRMARNARKLADTLLLVEGVEDALSLHMAFPYSAIIGLPGIGALKHQAIKPNQPVVVVKDGDAEDASAVRALHRGIDELLLRRASVHVTETPIKTNGGDKVDANLILQRDGIEALQQLVLRAPEAKLSPKGRVRQLATLSVLDYAQERKAAAKGLGIGVAVLDKQRDALRKGAEDSEGKSSFAHLVKREPEPWLGTVDLAEVFDELVALLRRLLVCTEAERWVITVWIIHTYIYEQFTYTPRLCIISPEPRCGKTTLVNILTHASYRAVQADGLSPALFTRLKSVVGPCTALLDEMSEALHTSPELDDVLRSGFERGKQVCKLRAMPDGSFVPEAFDVFAPVAIAVLRTPKAALSDRCLMIRLQRKGAGVRVERLRRRELREQVALIADKLARWKLEGGAQLSDDPIPEGAGDPIDALTAPLETAGVANDRQIDFSIPLLAIGRALGPRREPLLRQAIQTVLGAEGDTPEAIGVLLLQDLRPILDQHRAANADGLLEKLTLGSAELVHKLVALPDSPWNGEGGIRPLTQYRLARLLRPYKVLPRMSGPRERRVSGYSWLHLSEACDHYTFSSTPGPGENSSHSSHPPNKSTTYAAFQGSHREHGVNPENPVKPAAACGIVRGVNPERRGAQENNSKEGFSTPNREGSHNLNAKNSSLQNGAENDDQGAFPTQTAPLDQESW